MSKPVKRYVFIEGQVCAEPVAPKWDFYTRYVAAGSYSALEAECERLRGVERHLRQHKNDYMEAAEGTKRALEAYLSASRLQVTMLATCCGNVGNDRDALAAELGEYKAILRLMVEESTCADWSGESDDSVRAASQTWCGRFHHFKSEAEKLEPLRAELAAIKGQQADPVAWTLRREVDQCGLVRYMTQAKYDRQTDGIRSWYEPYKCASCSYQPSTAAQAGWRDHSVNYAKGEKPPQTIDTLQAAWDRDQELLLEQKAEIAKLKEKLNQARQKQPSTVALVEALEQIIEMNRQHANDQYGDADKAESWGCVTVARAAMAAHAHEGLSN